MIKLLNSFNHGGVVIPKGTQMNLPEEVEKALVENNNAEYVEPMKKEETNEKPKTKKSS